MRVFRPSLKEALIGSPYIIREFQKEIQYPFEPDTESVRRLISENFENMFICFGSVDGSLIGGIASIKIPHIFNRNVSASNEIFFWIHPEKRGGRTAALFLIEHENWRKRERVHIASLTSLASSPPSVNKFYEKLGYTHTENFFTQWPSQQQQ